MKTIGLFEAKTKLSEICDTIAKNGETVMITRRGEPLVRIEPIRKKSKNILELRAEYFARHPEEILDGEDFEIPERSRELPRDVDFGE